MNEYIITENQLKTAMEACLKREIPLPITNVFISGDKLPEIVRCGDCGYATPDTSGRKRYEGYLWCDMLTEGIGFSVAPSGFCAWGERRDA